MKALQVALHFVRHKSNSSQPSKRLIYIPQEYSMCARTSGGSVVDWDGEQYVKVTYWTRMEVWIPTLGEIALFNFSLA